MVSNTDLLMERVPQLYTRLSPVQMKAINNLSENVIIETINKVRDMNFVTYDYFIQMYEFTKRNSQTKTRAKDNLKFNNFEERDEDYELLEEDMLDWMDKYKLKGIEDKLNMFTKYPDHLGEYEDLRIFLSKNANGKKVYLTKDEAKRLSAIDTNIISIWCKAMAEFDVDRIFFKDFIDMYYLQKKLNSL